VGALLGSVIQDGEGLLIPVAFGVAAFVLSLTLMAMWGTRWFDRQMERVDVRFPSPEEARP
jgi:hypothetical protein